MAELFKNMFGDLKGKFGKAVFRNLNATNYVAQKASKYTPPSSESYAKMRNTFKIVSRIAKAINSSPVLKQFWTACIPKGLTPYNYLISKNYPAIENSIPNSLLMIVPESGEGVRLNSCSVTSDKLTLLLEPLTELSGMDTSKEKKVRLFSLLCLYAPLNSNSPSFDVILFSSSLQDFDLVTALRFEVPLSTNEANKLALYGENKLFSTIVTYSETLAVVNHTSTF
jgi:hypothetical protein